jgi:hypothetical protein
MKYATRFFWVGLFFFYASDLLHAQQPVISATGMMNHHIVQMDPLMFSSQLTCLDLRTGLSVYYGKRVVGDYNLNCKVDLFETKIGVQFYPIPTNQQGTLKSRYLLPFDKKFEVCIISMDGKILFTQIYTGLMLFNGVQIQTNNLIAGTYILKVYSEDWQEACKFIKL